MNVFLNVIIDCVSFFLIDCLKKTSLIFHNQLRNIGKRIKSTTKQKCISFLGKLLNIIAKAILYKLIVITSTPTYLMKDWTQ